MNFCRGGSVVSVLTVLMAIPALASPKDCSTIPIPAVPVSGTVGGKPFIPNDISIQVTKDGFGLNENKFDSYQLTLQSDGIFNALTVNFLVREGARADGKTFRVLPTSSISGQPSAMEGVPEVQGWDLQLETANVDTSFTRDVASMRLEFGQRKGNMMPGRIYFCVPSSNSAIMGTFNARIGQ